MHEDDGKPNTKSAVRVRWDVAGEKQEGFPPTLPPIAANSSRADPVQRIVLPCGCGSKVGVAGHDSEPNGDLPEPTLIFAANPVDAISTCPGCRDNENLIPAAFELTALSQLGRWY